MGQRSFLVHPSYFNGLKQLPDEYKIEAYEALFTYGIDGHLPEGLSAVTSAILTCLIPTIDSSIANYEAKSENGKKGGAPKGNQNAKKTTENNLKQPKTTENNLKQAKTTEKQAKTTENKQDKDKDMDRDMDREHTTDTKVSVCARTRDGDEQVVTHDVSKKSKRTKKPKKDIIDPNREQPFFNDSDLDGAFREYLRDRAEQGTDNTARAVKLLYTEMKKHDRSLWIPALEKATISHWKSIYFDSLERTPVRGSPCAKPDVFDQAMNELIEEYGPEFCGVKEAEYTAYEEVFP